MASLHCDECGLAIDYLDAYVQYEGTHGRCWTLCDSWACTKRFAKRAIELQPALWWPEQHFDQTNAWAYRLQFSEVY